MEERGKGCFTILAIKSSQCGLNCMGLKYIGGMLYNEGIKPC